MRLVALWRLEVGVAHGARVRQDVADVAHTGQIHDQALEAQTVAGVLAGTVAAQVKVVLVLLGIHAQVLDAGFEQIQALLALGAADNLADTGNQTVGGGDGLAVLVHAHVERLDLGRVVGYEGRALKVLLGQEALVLGLQVDAPADGVIKLVASSDGLLQDFDGLGIGDAGKVGVCHVVQALRADPCPQTC